MEKNKRAHDWRVVSTDNFARETVADKVVLPHLTHSQAERITEILRENCTNSGSLWYVVKHKEDKLCGGMADLV